MVPLTPQGKDKLIDQLTQALGDVRGVVNEAIQVGAVLSGPSEATYQIRREHMDRLRTAIVAIEDTKAFIIGS